MHSYHIHLTATQMQMQNLGWEKKIIYQLSSFNLYGCNFQVPNNLIGIVPYSRLNNHTIIILFIHKL